MDKRATYSEQSRWSIVFAALSMAIGAGNIWRMPKIAADVGGGVFFITYILAVFLWAVPVLCVEGVWGKATGQGAIGSFKQMCGKRWAWVGGIVSFIAVAVACYYAVVLGWCFRYLVLALNGSLVPGFNPEAAWETMVSAGVNHSLMYFLLSMAVCFAVYFAGLRRHLDNLNKVLIPCMFLLLLFMAIRSCAMPGAVNGLRYLFEIRPHDLKDANIYLNALVQVAWSTGAGWGLILTYFITRKDEDVMLSATTTVFADTLAGLLSVACVIPAIFALSPTPERLLVNDNPGFAFIHLTGLFAHVPGGQVMGAAFFLVLILAAINLEIVMISTGARALTDLGVKNEKKAFAVMGIICVAGGLPSAMDINVFKNQDWVWGTGLLVSGLCFAFGAMKAGTRNLWDQYILPTSNMPREKWLWNSVTLTPVWFAVIFCWWLQQAIAANPDKWQAVLPISENLYSPATMLAQWGALIAVFFALNGWLTRCMKPKEE